MNGGFRDVSEAAGELIWEVDANGLYTYVSRACATLLGYREDEIVGAIHFYDLHPEEGREEFRRKAFETFAAKAAFTDLYNPMVTKDGRLLDVVTNGVPVLGNDGCLLGYRGSDRDVTERNRSRQLIEESEARFRRLFYGSPVSLREEDYSEVKQYLDRLQATGVTDVDRYFREHPQAVRECASKVKVVDLNAAALQLHEAATKKELLSGIQVIFTDETYETFRDALISMAEGVTLFVGEAPIRTLQGRMRHIILRWCVAPGCETTFARVYVSQTDVTRLREAERAHERAENALRMSEEKYRSYVDNSPLAIAVVDADARFVEVNPAACQLSQYSAEELTRMSLMDIMASDDVQPTIERLNQLKATGRSAGEFRMRQKNGGILEIAVQGTQLAPDRFIGFWEDVTQNRLAEQRQSRSLKRLAAVNQLQEDLLLSAPWQKRQEGLRKQPWIS